ncbi:MAG: pyridoxamine 5'-phosphate oxidase family protein [Actinomycetota bacterium]
MATTVETSRFHDGELAIQRRAGVTDEAARLAGMLAEPSLDGGMHQFLTGRTFAVLTGRDAGGVLWTSPLAGPAGFLDGHGTTLDIETAPRPGDPLAGLPTGQPVGLIAIEFAIQRRVRVNGTLAVSQSGRLQVSADQAFGNCPKYIQRRIIEPVPMTKPATAGTAGSSGVTYTGTQLEPDQVRLIRGADTFFLGSTHAERGTDSSHRGGLPGFVRVSEGTLWWPDYPGNNMFNSFGNLAVDPTASLLFIDFPSGHSVHLSGTAEVEWTEPGTPGDDGWTGRRVRLTPTLIAQPEEPLAIQASPVVHYPRNPQLTGERQR